jgi:hypothetical protein
MLLYNIHIFLFILESGAIELEEFYQQAPKLIAACVNLGTDDDE